MGAALARAGYAVMTGGGPGPHGGGQSRRQGGGRSQHGLQHPAAPRTESPTQYLDKFIEFEHFFVRKVMLVKYSSAFVVMPGGYGTLDEAFEVATLIQTGKLERFPIIGLGGDFWLQLRKFARETMIDEGVISAAGHRVRAPGGVGRGSDELPAAVDGSVSRRARVGSRRISAATLASDGT